MTDCSIPDALTLSEEPVVDISVPIRVTEWGRAVLFCTLATALPYIVSGGREMSEGLATV